MTIHRRIRVCPLHKLRPRCPACDTTRHSDGVFPTLEVPRGTVAWLHEAARYFDEMGTEAATSFVEWVSVDLREVA